MRSSATMVTVMLAAVVSMTVACSRVGSTGRSDQVSLVGIAPGTIQLDLLSDGDPVIYWQYAVTPQTGKVRLISEARFDRGQEGKGIPQEFAQPTGKIGACWKNPSALSPDAKSQAGCRNEFDRRGPFSVIDHDAFIIENRTTDTATFHWKMEERRHIQGFAWSPESDAVAVLNLRQDYVRLGFLGHMALSYDSVYLDVIGMDHQFAEYVVRLDVVYAWSRILRWTPSEE